MVTLPLTDALVPIADAACRAEAGIATTHSQSVSELPTKQFETSENTISLPST